MLSLGKGRNLRTERSERLFSCSVVPSTAPGNHLDQHFSSPSQLERQRSAIQHPCSWRRCVALRSGSFFHGSEGMDRPKLGQVVQHVVHVFSCFSVLLMLFFPECVARVPVSLGGLGVRLCSPSFAFAVATVRNRPQPFA